MTPEEDIGYLEGLLRTAEDGAQAAATAMARYIAWRTSEITLRRHIHAPGEFSPHHPGEPPAYASGALAESIFYVPAYAGLRTTALVSTDSPYSRILEFGCVVTPKKETHVAWHDTGRPDNPSGWWRHEIVEIHAHPFLGPTTDEAIADGELQRAAIEAFREYDP